jgi:hypothetical protein
MPRYAAFAALSEGQKTQDVELSQFDSQRTFVIGREGGGLW